jgi:hypothetical protein
MTGKRPRARTAGQLAKVIAVWPGGQVPSPSTPTPGRVGGVPLCGHRRGWDEPGGGHGRGLVVERGVAGSRDAAGRRSAGWLPRGAWCRRVAVLAVVVSLLGAAAVVPLAGLAVFVLLGALTWAEHVRPGRLGSEPVGLWPILYDVSSTGRCRRRLRRDSPARGSDGAAARALDLADLATLPRGEPRPAAVTVVDLATQRRYREILRGDAELDGQPTRIVLFAEHLPKPLRGPFWTVYDGAVSPVIHRKNRRRQREHRAALAHFGGRNPYVRRAV